MERQCRMLVINLGSTSTKLAWFEGSRLVVAETIPCRSEEQDVRSSIRDRVPHREEEVRGFLKKNGIDPEQIDMIVSRGGLGKPAPAGAYEVDETMCEDLLEGRYGKHPSALGPAIALNFSRRYGSRAIVVDPPSTDEFHPLARVSGLPEIERKSAFHALNQKMVARRLAAKQGVKYEQMNLVVVHLGGGFSIGAHRKGLVIDCTHGLSEGPFTPERAGSLPTLDLIDLAFAGGMDKKKILKRLVGEGGLYAYFRTREVERVEEMVRHGDEKAKLILDAMAYQIAKDIGAMCVVLKGAVDAIILTGGLAHSEMVTNAVKEWVEFLAPVCVFPGEDEMTALAEGGLRVFLKQEEIRNTRTQEKAGHPFLSGRPPLKS